MLKSFLVVWLLYWTVVLVLPVHSIYAAVFAAFILQVGFVVLVTAGYCAIPLIVRRSSTPSVQSGRIVNSDKLIRLSFLLSVVGLACLVYDKIYIQGIDYSSGLAIAREQWRVLGEERDGEVSSLWSVFGYLLGSMYYVGLVLTITQAAFLRTGQRIAAMACVFFFAVANSIITGGRSNFLLLVLVGVAALSSRSALNVASVFRSRLQRRMFIAGATASVGYVVYVFYDRAQASDELIFAYVDNILPFLGLDFDGWFRDFVNEDWVGALGDTCVLVLGYLSHSFATVAAIMDAPHEDKSILFGNISSLLYKLGLIGRPDGGWFLAGRFPTVPGALWHQFGAFGFGLGSLLLGVMSGAAKVWASLAGARLLPLGAYVLMCATLMSSPFVFAPDILSFPYVVFGFVLLALVSPIYCLRPVRVAESGTPRP